MLLPKALQSTTQMLRGGCSSSFSGSSCGERPARGQGTARLSLAAGALLTCRGQDQSKPDSLPPSVPTWSSSSSRPALQLARSLEQCLPKPGSNDPQWEEQHQQFIQGLNRKNPTLPMAVAVNHLILSLFSRALVSKSCLLRPKTQKGAIHNEAAREGPSRFPGASPPASRKAQQSSV